MGRKPNQLILEFFERGPKLEDASNRYQHTCKSCGEKFPKGRIDSLTNHLVKKCPAIGMRDRQRAILQFHDLPADIADSGHTPIAPANSHSLDLPFAINKDMSALETLAEVSRQRLTLSPKHAGMRHDRNVAPPRQHQPQSTDILDQFLVHEDVRGDLNFNTGMERNGIVYPEFPMASFDGPGQQVHSVPHLFQYNNIATTSHENPHIQGLSIPPNIPQTSSMVPTPLMMAASAAQELLPSTSVTIEPELTPTNAGLPDKFFHNTGRGHWQNIQPNNIDPSLQESHGIPMVTSGPEPAPIRPNPYPRPIAMNPAGNTQTHFTTDFSINQKPGKPKVRGRFSDSRRKEVQEVRKRGACIRCRMLKKPCSGENPCSTCVSVESARLWKAPCIRTRIAECFDLYAASLHTVLAFHACGNAKKIFNLEKVPGRIEVSHRSGAVTYATFAFLKGPSSTLSTIDPSLATELEILDTDADDVAGKMEQYIANLAPTYHENEPSEFMRTTLFTLSRLSEGSKDDLLLKVLELWVATSILTDRSLTWQLFSNPGAAPSASLVTVTEADIEADTKTGNIRNPMTRSENRDSYELIDSQLLGAAEKRAATLSKVIMNDFERRLLQRQQAKPFETFLVAIILLACIERMCWYFRTWEFTNTKHLAATSGDSRTDDLQAQIQQLSSSPIDQRGGTQPLDTTASSSRWPLDKSPASYSQQGERFSDIVVMLLRMRAIPPKVVSRPSDGTLAVNGADVDAGVREWYESVAVTNDWLTDRANARFVGEDPLEWEGKYCHKVVSAGLS